MISSDLLGYLYTASSTWGDVLLQARLLGGALGGIVGARVARAARSTDLRFQDQRLGTEGVEAQGSI